MRAGLIPRCIHDTVDGRMDISTFSPPDQMDCHISGCQLSNVNIGAEKVKRAVSRELCAAERYKKMVLGLEA
jgi:hypothetical protein